MNVTLKSRSRIIYYLKHHIRMMAIIKICMSFILKLVGRFLPTDDSLVLFVSFMGKSFNDSPKCIYDYIKNKEKYKNMKCVWAFERPEQFPNVKSVKIDTIMYFFLAIRAKYWVTNTNIERGLDFKKKGTRYLNTWHGTTLKKIGNDCQNRGDYDFSKVDYMTVSGKYDEKIFKGAFNVSEKSYLKCGLPRNEFLWKNKENIKLIKDIKKKKQIPQDKKIILYAPTWRDSQDGGSTFSISPPIEIEKWVRKLSSNYILYFRSHIITDTVGGIEYSDFWRDGNIENDVNELLLIADVLITDYSAIAFDYSILERPIFCFAYDYKEYMKSRETYFDMDDLYPNKHFDTEDQLLDALTNINFEEEKLKTKRFKEMFMPYCGDATKKCVEYLFSKEFI